MLGSWLAEIPDATFVLNTVLFIATALALGLTLGMFEGLATDLAIDLRAHIPPRA